jgi:hypothetical protein
MVTRAMTNLAKKTTPKLLVTEVFANGDARCEVRWSHGQHADLGIDLGRVRNVNIATDKATNETVLSFTRIAANSGRLRRAGGARSPDSNGR